METEIVSFSEEALESSPECTPMEGSHVDESGTAPTGPKYEESTVDGSEAASLDELQKRIASMERRKMTRVDSAINELEETEEELWLRRVQICVSKLVLLDPNRKRTRANLYRYFHIWSLCLPLNQKCDELGKQLRERAAALETVRDSYLRDVVRIKFQLENVYDRQDNADKRAELMSMPSVDLRALVSEAFTGPEAAPSNQLQDLFVNGTTMKLANVDKLPWEYGKMFLEQKVNETGYAYKLPKVKAALVDLHAPSRHKLLVRYCPDCIGLMTLVHEWNEAVEDGLNGNVDKLQAKGLRGLVHNLTMVTQDQAKQIHDLQQELALAQPKEDWLDKRLEQKQDKLEIHRLTEECIKWRHMAMMSNAERETVEGNIRYNFSTKINRMRQDYDELLGQLNEAREECAYLHSEVDKMEEVFVKHEEHVTERKSEMNSMQQKINNLTMELDRCIRSRDEVVKGISAKDQYIIDQKEEHMERIDGLNEKIAVLNSEVERVMSDLEKTRQQLSEVTLAGIQARQKFMTDNKAIADHTLGLQGENDLLRMQLEDSRSAHHRDLLKLEELRSYNGARIRKRSGEDDAASIASENEEKKADIRRSLMLFPTKMRNTMASAIEQVVQLNKSTRLFSSAISTPKVGSRRPSKVPHSSGLSLAESPFREESSGIVPVNGDDLQSVGADESVGDISTIASAKGSSRNPSVYRAARLSVSSTLPKELVPHQENPLSLAEIPTLLEGEGSMAESLGQTRIPISSDSGIEQESLSDGSADDGEMTEIDRLVKEGEMLDDIKEGLDRLVDQVLPNIPSSAWGPSLRVVAIGIRFLVRLRTGLVRREFPLLGAYGLKILCTLQDRDLRQSRKLIQTGLGDKKTQMLESQLVEASSKVAALITESEDKSIQFLKQVEFLQKDLDCKREALEEAKMIITRERVICRAQRSHAEYLATHMSVFRARLHLMIHAKEVAELVPDGMIVPSKAAPKEVPLASTPKVSKKRLTMNFGTKAYAEEQKSKLAAVLSDDEDENDVTKLPLYKVRKVFFHVLSRLRKLKFDRPFRRANSMLLSWKHGKAIGPWIVREEQILSAFVRDAADELQEVERILKTMRHQSAEDRRKAEAFRALLGVDTPLSIGMSFVGEQPASMRTLERRLMGISSAKPHEIIDPMPEVTDITNSYSIGADMNSLRLLSSFRLRELRPGLDFLKDGLSRVTTGEAAAVASSRLSIMSRTQSTIVETSAGAEARPLARGNALPRSLTDSLQTIEEAAEVKNPKPSVESKQTLRQKMRRNAFSGPAGLRPDDNHKKMVKLESEISRAVAIGNMQEKKIDSLTTRVDELETELVNGYSEQARLQAELDLMIEDYEFLRKQNNSLKIAVSDSYRICYDTTTEELRRLGLDKTFFQQQNMRSKATQVACVACDLPVHDPTLGPHEHNNAQLRSMLRERLGDDEREHTSDFRNAVNDVIGPFANELQPQVLSKGNLAQRVSSPERVSSPTTLERGHMQQGHRDQHKHMTDVERTRLEFEKAWEALMKTGNVTDGVKSQRALSLRRPRSAVPLRTTHQMYSGAPMDPSKVRELRGLGDLALTECSTEVRATDSLKPMHRDVHNASTDITTDRVHITAANQYLQYLHEQKHRPATTFSKIKSIPRQLSKCRDPPTTRPVLSTSASEPFGMSDIRDEMPAQRRVRIDLRRPVQEATGAIAHMASALQVLHEVRENQVAMADKAARVTPSSFKTDVDREAEVQGSLMGATLSVSGAPHHERDIYSSKNARPKSSRRPPLVISPDVTPNGIYRVDGDAYDPLRGTGNSMFN